MINTNKNSLQRTSMILLALYPVFSYYSFINEYSYAVVGVAAISIYALIYSTLWSFKYPKWYLVYWAVFAIVTWLKVESLKATIIIPGGIPFLVWSLQFPLFVYYFNFEYFWKYTRYVFFAAAILFAYQYVLMKTSGSFPSVFLPLGTQTLYCDMTFQELVQQQISASRCPSIFPEPAYFGEFCSIVLSIELFCKNNIKKIITPFTVIIIFVVICLQSGTAVIITSLLVFIKILHYYFSTKKTSALFASVVALIAVGYSINYFIDTEIGTALMARSTEFDNENASGSIRLVSGFLTFSRLDASQQIIGVNNSFLDYIMHNGALDVSFFNGVAFALTCNGIIAFVIYVIFIISLCRKAPFLSKALAITFLVMSLFEATYHREFTMVIVSVLMALMDTSTNIQANEGANER